MSIFNNIEIAFKDKSDNDLKRSYILFKTINNRYVSKILISLLKLAIFIKLPINRIIKSTIYKHFCGGTTIEDSQSTINKLWKSNIGTILDYSAEGKEEEVDLNRAKDEIILSIRNAKKKKKIPFCVFKMTAIARFRLLEKMNKDEILEENEEIERKSFIKRVEDICQSAKENRVSLFIDAEESWIQNTIDDIALKMIKKFNKNEILIFNTLQMYRRDRISYLESIINNARKEKYYIGVKLVRGAYHEQETERSKNQNYPNPVFNKKEDTDLHFNKSLDLSMKNIDILSICAGTHNEESCNILMNLMNKYKINKNDKRIYFSQLYGMSDHISYNAAKEGFNVAKYVPYGPVKEVIPYLIRRAEENTSITGQINRELTNIIKEIMRRKKIK